MKFLTAMSFLLITTSGFAETPKKTTNLEDQKTLSRNQIDSAITRLEEKRPCVKDAESTEELKKCRNELRADLKELSESIKESREDVRKHHKNKSKSI